MVDDFLKFLYPLFIIQQIRKALSERRRRKEINKKMANFEPVTEEEFNIWKKHNPVFEKYADYMRIANATPEEKERLLKTSDMVIKTINEHMEKDPKFKVKKYFGGN